MNGIFNHLWQSTAFAAASRFGVPGTAPQFTAPAVLAVAGGLGKIPGPVFAVRLDGRADTASS